MIYHVLCIACMHVGQSFKKRSRALPTDKGTPPTQAADLLENRPNGAFLIRESASDKGDYSLACRSVQQPRCG